MTEPETVLNNYREALRRFYGDAKADASELYYWKGWYYVKLARKCPDGSYLTPGIADGKRKRQVIEMTETLLGRLQWYTM